ncbi:hypothetical protein COT72_01275 [archaeon CG10_big_fil_rev_8_21_14_0_10_43_11]|nr:MAG: hypothetical protein COT72_01275 [archaeon CG10_big_fil_rev_8_21_14_0_10_43_11]
MFSLAELFGIAISSIGVTYIFSGLIPGQMKDKERFKLSALIAIPSLLLHEFAHKFVAIAFGMSATYHANFWGLFIGVALKTMGLPIFFVPAYVSISAFTATKTGLILTGLAGPALNGFLFAITYPLEKYMKTRNQHILLYVTRQINMWLLILNLLPIPGTDGFNALRYLLA